MLIGSCRRFILQFWFRREQGLLLLLASVVVLAISQQSHGNLGLSDICSQQLLVLVCDHTTGPLLDFLAGKQLVGHLVPLVRVDELWMLMDGVRVLHDALSMLLLADEVLRVAGVETCFSPLPPTMSQT